MGKCRHDWHKFNARDRFCQTCGAVGSYSLKRNTTFIYHVGQPDYARLQELVQAYHKAKS